MKAWYGLLGFLCLAALVGTLAAPAISLISFARSWRGHKETAIREEEIEQRARMLLCENGFTPYCAPVRGKKPLEPEQPSGAIIQRTVTYQVKEEVAAK